MFAVCPCSQLAVRTARMKGSRVVGRSRVPDVDLVQLSYGPLGAKEARNDSGVVALVRQPDIFVNAAVSGETAAVTEDASQQ